MYDSSWHQPRRNLIFALYTDVRLGGGTENVIFQLILNSPMDLFNVTLLETDLLDMARISPEQIRRLEKKVQIIKIRSLRGKFHFLRRSLIGRLLDSVFVELMLAPFQSKLYKYITLSFPPNSIVFLSKNSDYKYFRRNENILVGSSHTISKFEFNLVMRGLLYKKVKHFQIFPGMLPNTTLGVLDEPRRFLTLPNGVDTNLFYPRDNNTKMARTSFLFVGRLEKYKGVKELSSAWECVKNHVNADLHIVGGGPLGSLFLAGTPRNTIFHGLVSSKELSEIYGRSDIFVYPTLRDNYPLVVLEALSSGLVVLASDTLKGKFDDFADRGYLLYFSNNRKELSRILVESVEKVEKYRNMKSEIHEYTRENYDWKRITEQFFEYIGNL